LPLTPRKILLLFGTRPEAIKMAPVQRALKERPREFRVRTVVTAQHRRLLDDVLTFFKIRPDHDLNLMRPGQAPLDVLARALRALGPLFERERPHLVLVHGDTTTALAGALAAFHRQVPLGHVEAGLRSRDMANPFPEEANRRLVDALATLHFAPTARARRNLLQEGTPPEGIFVTGNTGIDALKWGISQIVPRLSNGILVLVTAHRRENFGAPFQSLCAGLADAARARPDVEFVYPVHPNPEIKKPVETHLRPLPNVRLLPPVAYPDLLGYLARARLVVTDSGGLQEEAPSLGIPVLVLRRVTERPEAVRAGTVRVIGTDRAHVRHEVLRLLSDNRLHARMARAVNPYGDGRAAGRTVRALRHYFSPGLPRPPSFLPA
jgi:UDP-N-acetylglucosamine 2-epimerase (non-hydrolysing)